MSQANTPLSGADILVQCLVNHGVEVVFAYPGGASMPLHQALTRFEHKIRTILPRHEQGGGFAAIGYARSAGRVGVCMATSGPGATNLVTCLAANAANALRAFAEKTGVPVAMTVHGLGAFPSEHYLSLQMLGMHGTAYANYAINEADLLLAFGVRFDDRVTGKVSEFAKHGKIVHVDIDPSEINKNKVAHIPIVADVGQTLQGLLEILDEQRPQPIIRSARFADWIRQVEH